LKRTIVLLASTAALTLGIAATAQAHLLTHKEARNAAFTLVKRDCKKVPTCEGVEAGPSKRINRHKVAVLTHFYGSNAQTGPYDCHRVYDISIKRGSDQRYYTRGPLRCQPNTDHP
jgi:hypothetical protein